eukprot:6174701-Pleurochrysis_carterae.AAC.2
MYCRARYDTCQGRNLAWTIPNEGARAWSWYPSNNTSNKGIGVGVDARVLAGAGLPGGWTTLLPLRRTLRVRDVACPHAFSRARVGKKGAYVLASVGASMRECRQGVRARARARARVLVRACVRACVRRRPCAPMRPRARMNTRVRARARTCSAGRQSSARSGSSAGALSASSPGSPPATRLKARAQTGPACA